MSGSERFSVERQRTHGNVRHEVAVGRSVHGGSRADETYPSMTSAGGAVVNHMAIKEVVRGRTHMEPFGTPFNHPLAFCGKLAEV